MSAGQNIKHALIEKNMQQKELAKKLNVTGASLSQMLNKDNMRYNKAEEIAKILGYKIVWIKDEDCQTNVNQTINNNNGNINNSGFMGIGIQNNIKE